MADWQLLAFVSFSVAGVLLVVLVVVTGVMLRRRRCTRMNYRVKVLELKENLKAAHAAKEEKEEEFTSLRRSVADFDAERSLLLKRLESCGTNSTPEEIRRCLRELQLYLAFQSANSSCLRKAVNSDCTKGPPALLAEVWLVHGQIYTARDDDSYPCLGEYGAMTVFTQNEHQKSGEANSLPTNGLI
ncbi:UNVERIFIED_CONTAM: transmembrane protein, putative [Hammondia hammondi]|eukprot:XP_008881693.1 transmembrane protein, putative [Hammondia hammondi]